MQPQSLRYPPRADYVDALQNPHLTLVDPALKTGAVECDRLGLPTAISGAFASVFQVRAADGSRWAVKCFCQSVPDQERRYDAITQALKGLSHPALAAFEFQQAGILIGGRRFPILKMRWLDGQGLLPWIEHNRFDGFRLRMIAEQLVELIGSLEAAGIAHGDLQHGNLLVTSSDQLRLIDYDGMYVPALAGLAACEIGLANYQSPHRANRHFQPGLDRFAGWIIYASLVALSEMPGLWDQLRVDGDEKLLFGADDYKDPRRSPGISALRASGQPNLVLLSNVLATIATSSIDALPALTSLPSTTGGSPAVPSQHTSRGLPSWLDAAPAGPVAATQSAASTEAPPDGSWLQQHLPPLPRHIFKGATSGIRRITALVSLIAIVVGLGLVPLLSFMAAILALVAVFGLILNHRTHPVLRAAVVARQRRTAAQKAYRTTKRGYETTTKQLAKLTDFLEGQKRSFGQGRLAAKQELNRATDTINTMLQRRLADEAREIMTIDQSIAGERAKRLNQLRQQHINRNLSQLRITSAAIHGIGSQLCDRLASRGIRTAADFTGYSVTGSQATRNEKTVIRLPSGITTHIDGIGPKKAQALEAWRLQATRRAEQTQPNTLSQVDEQQLQRDLDAARLNTKQQTRNVKTTAQQQLAAARHQENAKRQTIDQQERAAIDAYTQSRQPFDNLLSQTQRRLAELRVRLGEAEQSADSFALITMKSFVLFVALGK